MLSKILKDFTRIETKLQAYLERNAQMVQDNNKIREDADKRISDLQTDSSKARAVLTNLQNLLNKSEA